MVTTITTITSAYFDSSLNRNATGGYRYRSEITSYIAPSFTPTATPTSSYNRTGYNYSSSRYYVSIEVYYPFSAVPASELRSTPHWTPGTYTYVGGSGGGGSDSGSGSGSRGSSSSTGTLEVLICYRGAACVTVRTFIIMISVIIPIIFIVCGCCIYHRVKKKKAPAVVDNPLPQRPLTYLTRTRQTMNTSRWGPGRTLGTGARNG